MGLASGLILGSLLSATVLAPLLGGGRAVLIAYGLIGALFSIAWFFARTNAGTPRAAVAPPSLRLALRHVTGLKNIWLLGFGPFGISDAIQGSVIGLRSRLPGAGEGWQTHRPARGHGDRRRASDRAE